MPNDILATRELGQNRSGYSQERPIFKSLLAMTTRKLFQCSILGILYTFLTPLSMAIAWLYIWLFWLRKKHSFECSAQRDWREQSKKPAGFYVCNSKECFWSSTEQRKVRGGDFAMNLTTSRHSAKL